VTHEPIQHVEYHDHHSPHPSARKYMWVAIFLAIITAIEVAIYYFDMPQWTLITGLLIFAMIKFSFVARWFMHLKFDENVFKMFFVMGLVTALIVFTVVLLVFFLANDGPAPLITNGG
jgi:caa(3)-type oxidase subunit IV